MRLKSSAGAAVVQQRPSLFAFAGQSNMIGYSTEGSSSDTTQYQAIMDILQENQLSNVEKELLLERKFLEADEAELYPEASTFQAQYMLQLQDRGLLQEIDTPIPNAYCSYRGPDLEPVNATNVSTKSNCGSEFGSELMFSRSLVSMGYPWNSSDFVVSKVAEGGSELYENWTSPEANMWKTLNSTIHNTEGVWRAFVWHQGENDCFIQEDDEDTSLTYETNLTVLINRTRSEMHAATPYYSSALDIPVVIVMVHWPLGPSVAERYGRVVQAQKRVADNDPKAVFVNTSDLKGSYHMNAGSLFVVGDRIAQQLAPLLTEEEIGSTPVPSTTPVVSARWSGCKNRLCRFIISNSHTSDIYRITRMQITWPPSSGSQTLPQLDRVKQEDVSIWRTTSQTSPTVITIWKGEEVDREITPGLERQYKLKFENGTVLDENVDKYTLELTLENTSTGESTLLIL